MNRDTRAERTRATPEASPPALDIAHLQSWVGRSQTQHDTLTLAPMAALSATLDRDDAPPQAGDALPPLWHWLYFLPMARQSQIGPDGHPLRGGFLPPVPLPRRMWAGGRFEFLRPLRAGQLVSRTSTIESVTHKRGRSGDLVFVLVRHKVADADGVALIEEHDIVYRDAARPGEAPPAPQPARTDGVWSRDIVPDDVLLFRYSALTFNGHRIHYDRRYVTQVEGYPGLIVHGPLIATLLLDLLRRQWPQATVTAFAFRALQPVFDTETFSVHGAPQAGDPQQIDLWTRNARGEVTMQATATIAPQGDAA
ncbi:FAS1-like dehydratase domain-containing protein [Amphibiibacter pelophylacis]|uniref:MaoC family dehydratase N-terminal domain-containing protein n=1 Tax=Amphibiibacter pelophylacis TaxID=1799477 RepID=A0ACC6NZY1_9BURK